MMQEELLRILENEKKTMIFVTHSIDEAILLGDRIVDDVAPSRAHPGNPSRSIFRAREKFSQSEPTRSYIELRNSIWEMLKQDLTS